MSAPLRLVGAAEPPTRGAVADVACDESATPSPEQDPVLAYLARAIPMPPRGTLQLPGRPAHPERLAPVPRPEPGVYAPGRRIPLPSGRGGDLAAALALIPDSAARAGRAKP